MNNQPIEESHAAAFELPARRRACAYELQCYLGSSGRIEQSTRAGPAPSGANGLPSSSQVTRGRPCASAFSVSSLTADLKPHSPVIGSSEAICVSASR